jgi:protein-L-isoaspartate(D-aspartate) O-methyltransferase
MLWPGSEGAAAGNFGVPQLVLMGTYAQQQTNATVEIRDLAIERILGSESLPQMLAGPDGRGFDIVALSIYSSYDHLKCTAIAELVRQSWPDAVIVAGGYHASARPLEYLEEDAPFDVIVVGEGEKPLVQIIESVAGGAPLRHTVLGPQAVDHLDEMPPSDWSLLARYRTVARQVASQAQVYLSRGCPFDCAFCMERAKREVSWRSLSVQRALDEIESLHRFLDLRTWTLYFGDALFGMKKSWRRAFLEGLARRDIPVDKYWLLIRVDLVDDEDLKLFGAANCGLGFGLESGDPGLLATIRKTGRLDTYLDQMLHIAERAREHDVPWGANIICGHPGETPDTMRRSAAYMRKLFLQPRGTTGFLSVDPFRLYPGSPIDAERGEYERRFGTVFHRPHWWDDGDPAFLSEWVDPSSELDYLTRERLQHELLVPILAQVEDHFVYRGQARDYFLRAIQEQVAFATPRSRLHEMDRYYAWHQYLGRGTEAEATRREHTALAQIMTSLRREIIDDVARVARLDPADPILAAILETPRERFVPLDEIAASVRDEPVVLDASGLATISAMHAYARSFSLLQVTAGDRVLDLGAGTGYGTTLLSRLVGETGAVVGLELDAALVQRGAPEVAELTPNATYGQGDALDPKTWPASAATCTKVTVGFAVPALPDAWLTALPEGTRIVAPVGEGDTQRLVVATHCGDHFDVRVLDHVVYVRARRTSDLPVRAPAAATPPVLPTPERRERHLPVVD